MSIRNFNTTPNLDVVNVEDLLSKEQYALLKKGWKDHLAKEGWACPRFNMVYALLRGVPLTKAFTPLINPSKMQANPTPDPWFFVNSRSKILADDSNLATHKHSANLPYTIKRVTSEWWKPWEDLLPLEILIELGHRVSLAITERKNTMQ